MYLTDGNIILGIAVFIFLGAAVNDAARSYYDYKSKKPFKDNKWRH